MEEGEYNPLHLLVKDMEAETFLDNQEGHLPLPQQTPFLPCFPILQEAQKTPPPLLHSEILPRMRWVRSFLAYSLVLLANDMLVGFRSLSLMPVLRDELPREETLLWDQLSLPWRKPSLPLVSPSLPLQQTPEYSSNSPIYHPGSLPPLPLLSSSPNLRLEGISQASHVDRTTFAMVPSPPPSPPCPVLVDHTNFRAFRQ